MKKDIDLDLPGRRNKDLKAIIALCEEMNPRSLVIGGISFDGEPFCIASCSNKVDEMAIVQYVNTAQIAKQIEESDLYE